MPVLRAVAHRQNAPNAGDYRGAQAQARAEDRVTDAVKRKRGRPRKPIDLGILEQLAMIHCTVDEMASIIGCNKRTLERNYAAVIKTGKEKGLMSLRRAQFKSATSGNVTAQIWLGKQLLGQRDQRDAPVGDPEAVARGIRDLVGALLATEPAI